MSDGMHNPDCSIRVRMKHEIRNRMNIFILCLCLGTVLSAQDAPIYKGVRISVFDCAIVQQGSNSAILRCKVANTGRLPVQFSGNRAPSLSLVVEFDTARLPTVVRGREQKIRNTLLREKINLKPGDIKEDVLLELNFKRAVPAPDTAQWITPGAVCGDLVFDTIFVRDYDARSLKVRYLVRNVGTQPVHLLSRRGEGNNLGINAYFVLTDRLTRGSLLADGMFIREGKETLDGLLPPGGVLQGDMEVSMKSKTKFTPNLLLELDPFQTTDECNRLNNTRHIALKL
jgi:hypothetical protein